MQIKTVGVLGCGLMGAGIAQISAAAGYKTIVREVEDSLIKKGLARIDKFLAGGVEKGKVTPQDKERTLANLSGTTKFEDLSACDIIVEAIIENVDEKAKTYAALDAIVGEPTIYCSNTSSLCITELASKTRRPDRFAGLHFFNPVPIMKLVEVIRALTTSDETYRAVFAFAQSLGKEPITAPDKPGFIVNRLLVPYLLDARLRVSHGPVHAARFRRPRHDLLHRQHHVRRVSRARLRAAAAPEAHGARRTVGTKDRARLL